MGIVWKIKREGVPDELLSQEEYERLKCLGKVVKTSKLPNGTDYEEIEMSHDKEPYIIKAYSEVQKTQKVKSKDRDILKIKNPKFNEEVLIFIVMIILIFTTGYLTQKNNKERRLKTPQKYKYTITIDTDKEKFILKTNKAKVTKISKEKHEDTGIEGYLPFLIWFL